MNYYVEVLKKYAVFNGRASRAEYWYFVLFSFIIMVFLGVIDYFTGTMAPRGMGVLGQIYSVAVLLPSVGVAIRRLHDVGKSGWMMLINLIPLIGPIWFLILMLTQGDASENEYGKVPS